MKSLIFSNYSNANIELAETFSIGLTLLDVALLGNSEDIYNYSNFRIEY